MFAAVGALGFIVSAVMLIMIVIIGIMMVSIYNLNHRLKTVEKKDRDI